MIVEIDSNSGFCFGVVKAITKAEETLASVPTVYCLGDIVHNRVEVSRLEKLGLRCIKRNDIDSLEGKTVLIRAHGEPPSTYAVAEKLGIRIVDATCPVVAALQDKVKTAGEAMEKSGGEVVILGKKGHAEVVGLTGQVDEKAIVIESSEDLDLLDFSRPIYLLSQTTQSLSLFERIKEEIASRMADTGMLTVNDTICRHVSNRNPLLKEFASRYDVVIFVSGKKSSNGEVLFRSCREMNANCHKVEDVDEICPEWFEEKNSVGICGATSTPKWLMQKVADHIKSL